MFYENLTLDISAAIPRHAKAIVFLAEDNDGIQASTLSFFRGNGCFTIAPKSASSASSATIRDSDEKMGKCRKSTRTEQEKEEIGGNEQDVHDN